MVSKIFYLSELLKFAIEREVESFDLYTHMAEHSKDSELKSLFSKLAEQETKHKAFYTEMLEHTASEHSPRAPAEGDEYMAYIKNLISSQRTVPSLSEEQLHDPIQALDYAIGREKDSILFYTGLKHYVPEASHDKVDVIIHEEMKHASILTKVKEQYKK
jgi:rubrerythrin